MHPGPGQLHMMRGFTSDSSVTKQQLKRGTVRRIAGCARPYRRQLAIFLLAAALDAGIRLHFARLRAAEMRDAVRAVLGDPAYRNAACRVRDSFAAAGGATAAADHLEELL
jgi:hypothetical protein